MCQYNFFWNFIETCVAAGNKWAATPYDATHVNVVSSTIKITLENWYKTNVVDTNNTSYIAENIFCNDKTLKKGTGIGEEDTYYNGYYSKSLECAKNADNNYSRFTSKNNTSDTTVKGVKINKDLTYPIGLLSYNEAKYAGIGSYDESLGEYDSSKSYLYNSTSSFWWLLFPISNDGGAYNWTFNNWYGLVNSYPVMGNSGVRPSINIKSSVLISGGDGTSSNPYTLKLK